MKKNKPKQIVIKNESGHELKILLLTEKGKYQTQTPRKSIANNEKRTFEITPDFVRIVLSKD